MEIHNEYFDEWAAGGYATSLSAHPSYWEEYLESFPGLVFQVAPPCFDLLMRNHGAAVRRGLAKSWKVLFGCSRDRLVQRHQDFRDELLPHFQKIPGLWYYIFRYDVMKMNPRTKEHTDVGYLAMVQVQKNWGMLSEDGI